jgi:hypothetical protein
MTSVYEIVDNELKVFESLIPNETALLTEVIETGMGVRVVHVTPSKVILLSQNLQEVIESYESPSPVKSATLIK